MSYPTISALRAALGGKSGPTPEWQAKMLHPIPAATGVDRAVFILQHVAGKCVLEFGASGPMHDAIVKAAAKVVGVDRESDGKTVIGFNLDDVTLDLPDTDFNLLGAAGPDIIICGEVIEHLSNPGWFLTRLKRQYPGVPVIITVPNAFAEAGRRYVERGIECVNPDHCAWYSPKTLSVLLERAGYKVGALYWYGGKGPTAEGLIVCTE